MAEVSDPATVKLWNVAHPREVGSLAGYTNRNVRAVAFSPTGMTLASGDWDGWIRLWSLPARNETARFRAHEGPIVGLQFSPDGRVLASSQGGGSTKLWNLATQALEYSFDDDINLGYGAPIAFSPDTKLLAIGSNRVKLWDIAGRRVLALMEGHKAPIMAVRFSPDGRTLATGSVDHSVKLWSLTTRQEVATLAGHTGPVSGLAFSSNGTILASCSEDKTIRLWRAISPEEAMQVKGTASK